MRVPGAIMAAAAGAGTGAKGRFCQTPLVAAAAAGHAAMVKLLLERGADPELRDGNGKTAADVATRGAFFDVLGELARVRRGNFFPRGRSVAADEIRSVFRVRYRSREVRVHCASTVA